MFCIYAQEYMAKNLSFSSSVSCKIHEDKYIVIESLYRDKDFVTDFGFVVCFLSFW